MVEGACEVVQDLILYDVISNNTVTIGVVVFTFCHWNRYVLSLHQNIDFVFVGLELLKYFRLNPTF